MQFLWETFEIKIFKKMIDEWAEKERGCFPTPIECIIILWVFSIMWKEVKEVYEIGLREYVLGMIRCQK